MSTEPNERFTDTREMVRFHWAAENNSPRRILIPTHYFTGKVYLLDAFSSSGHYTLKVVLP